MISIIEFYGAKLPLLLSNVIDLKVVAIEFHGN
jgi:hypothetical protein